MAKKKSKEVLERVETPEVPAFLEPSEQVPEIQAWKPVPIPEDIPAFFGNNFPQFTPEWRLSKAMTELSYAMIALLGRNHPDLGNMIANIEIFQRDLLETAGVEKT
jgi:hypothetical protein